jgi:hypothetical protein
VPAREQTGLAQLLTGRGAAFGDLFNDGKIDVVVNQLEGTPTLLRNVVTGPQHWVAFRLIGSDKSPRDATGASVYVTTGQIRQRGDIISGGSFASNNDPRVHFGLGTANRIDSVEIHWPDRQVQRISIDKVDRIYTIEQRKSGVFPGQ